MGRNLGKRPLYKNLVTGHNYIMYHFMLFTKSSHASMPLALFSGSPKRESLGMRLNEHHYILVDHGWSMCLGHCWTLIIIL